LFLTALLLVLSSDLSTYRQFHFGMDLPAAEKLAKLTPADAKVVCKRPALVETLEWQPRRTGPADSVDNVEFGFYNNQLFRIVVYYQRLRTVGMTTEDMIDSISSVYGPATRPDVKIVLPSYDSESEKVLARWEDADYSYNLVHSFMTSFSLIAESKSLKDPAQAAIAASRKLDLDEAPANALARSTQEASDEKLVLEKARIANKAGFRP
jgi:hypothetical protein